MTTLTADRVRAALRYEAGTGYFYWRESRFSAEIRIDGRRHYLGRFDTKDAAHAAYISAKRRLHPGRTI